MKEFLTLEQNSPEWEQFREKTTRLGASTIGTLLGFNRYQSRDGYLYQYKQRLLEKYREEYENKKRFEGNEATRFGKLNEAEGVLCFQDWFFENFEPRKLEIRKIGSVLGYRKQDSRLFCSPDALVYSDNSLFGVEMKCPFNPDNIPKSIKKINPMHIAQCIQCMYLTDAEGWFLCYYDPRTKFLSIYYVERNTSSGMIMNYIRMFSHDVFLLMLKDESFSKKMCKAEKDYYSKLLYQSVRECTGL